jgi:hypothetical protein
VIQHQQQKGSNMKKRLITALFAASAFALRALGQGTFQNLNFEAARVVIATNHIDSYIATSNALPGWMAFSGTNQLFLVDFNPTGLLVPAPVALYGSNAPLVIDGTYSLGLSGRGSVSQIGLVPADAQLLLFKANLYGLLTLVVSLDGQDLSYTALSSGPNYTLYAANISAFAGQTAALTFETPNLVVLDDIGFAVPEPSALALLGLAGAVLALSPVRRQCLRSRPRGVTSNALPRDRLSALGGPHHLGRPVLLPDGTLTGGRQA